MHLAVINQHGEILKALLKSPEANLILRDRKGLTPFATAMQSKNNKAAELIQNRDPRTTSQVSFLMQAFDFFKINAFFVSFYGHVL